MGVGEENAVEPLDVESQQLFAQVRRSVDQRLRAGAIRPGLLDEDRTPPPPVLGVGRIASAPALPDARNAPRRSAAQNRDRKTHSAAASRAAGGGIFEKSRKALALVCSARVETLTALTSARTLSVAATKAGSLRLPR